MNDPDSDVSRLLRDRETVRVVSKPVDTKPNMFYLAETMPADWPGSVEYPAAHQAMTGFVNPLVKIAVGISGLGVAAMFLKQLFTGDETSGNDKEEV
jgi:tetrathionate reductase subunit B